MLSLAMGIGCGAAAEEPACDRTPALSYENFGQGFMEKNCTGCHSSLLQPQDRNYAPVGVDFDTYAGVVEWWDRIEARAVLKDPSPMPPAGGPSAEELEKLGEWLSCDVKADAEALAAQEEE